jgi:hypothetical protein
MGVKYMHTYLNLIMVNENGGRHDCPPNKVVVKKHCRKRRRTKSQMKGARPTPIKTKRPDGDQKKKKRVIVPEPVGGGHGNKKRVIEPVPMRGSLSVGQKHHNDRMSRLFERIESGTGAYKHSDVYEHGAPSKKKGKRKKSTKKKRKKSKALGY